MDDVELPEDDPMNTRTVAGTTGPLTEEDRGGTSDDGGSSTERRHSAAQLTERHLSPERLEVIRERLQSGFYDSECVIDAVARRILDGDVREG